MDQAMKERVQRNKRIAKKREKAEGRRVGMERDRFALDHYHLGGTFMTGQAKMQVEEASFVACFECGCSGGRHLKVCPRAVSSPAA